MGSIETGPAALALVAMLALGRMASAEDAINDAMSAPAGGPPGEESVPAAGDDGAAQARAILESAFANHCYGAIDGMFRDTAPDIHMIEDRPDGADAQPERYTLYRFSCDAGAYNLIDVWMIAYPDGTPEPLAFATPRIDVTYADPEETVVATTAVIGFGSDPSLINSDYDAETRTIRSFSKWRGIGDAYESGTWTFRRGEFVLTSYEIDPTFDGEVTPVTVYGGSDE